MTQGIGISPDFIALITHAARETIRIQLPSRAIATSMRAKLHSARKHIFRVASTPSATPQDRMLSSLAQSIETAIEHDKETGITHLVVRPRDIMFRDALAAAGVKLDDSPQPPAPGGPLFLDDGTPMGWVGNEWLPIGPGGLTQVDALSRYLKGGDKS